MSAGNRGPRAQAVVAAASRERQRMIEEAPAAVRDADGNWFLDDQ